MSVAERKNVAWTRKHDDPRVPFRASAARILYPSTLAELIEACSKPLPLPAMRAAGSHWGLSEAAVSDHTFIETHDPTGAIPALGRTLFEVIPECMTDAAMDAVMQQADTALDEDVEVNKGTYFVHFETGKRVYQLYAELDLGDEGHKRSLAVAVARRPGGHRGLMGPWGIPTLGGAGGQTVFGALTTGTHGGDIELPPIADAVVAMHLVTEGGRHCWIERERPIDIDGKQVYLCDEARLNKLYGRAELGGPQMFSVERDDDLFDAVLMGAGRFGVVYSVVMRAVRQYCLHEERRLTTWTAVRGQVNDLTSPLYDRKFLQIAVNTTPGRNFSSNLCGVTKRWNTPLSAASLAGVPNGRAERRGDPSNSADPMAPDPMINAPRFDRAGTEFTYAPDPAAPGRALNPNFLDLACTSDDLVIGVIDKVTSDIKNFVASQGAVVGTTLAAVVASGAAPTLLLLLGPLALIVVALAAVLAALQSSGAAGQLGGALDQVRRALLDKPAGTSAAERAAGVLAWQAIVNDLFAERQGNLDFDAISYAVMDRHNYRDRSCEVHADSMEVFFDAQDTRLVAFVDAVLDFEMRQQNTGRAFAGWLSLRFTGRTRALLGMQQFDTTCAVEIAGLLGVSGTRELIGFADALALRLGALVHWGQRNTLTMAQLQARFGDGPVTAPSAAPARSPLHRWRLVLSRLTDNGAKAAFSSAFTRRVGLEVMQPEITDFALVTANVPAGSAIRYRWDCLRNPPGVRVVITLKRATDGSTVQVRRSTLLAGASLFSVHPAGAYVVELMLQRTLNRQTRELTRTLACRVG